MKGAVLISNDSRFFDECAAAISKREPHCVTGGGHLQFADASGTLFTLSSSPVQEFDEIAATVDPAIRQDGFIHDFLVDCRSEDLFCRTVQFLARQTSGRFVVVDNSGIVRAPEEIHAETLLL